MREGPHRRLGIGVEPDGLLAVTCAAGEVACSRRALTPGLNGARQSELLTRIVASGLEVDCLKPRSCLLAGLVCFR